MALVWLVIELGSELYRDPTNIMSASDALNVEQRWDVIPSLSLET